MTAQPPPCLHSLFSCKINYIYLSDILSLAWPDLEEACVSRFLTEIFSFKTLTCLFILFLDLYFLLLFSFQLVDASTLKKEVAEGVDLMVVRELTGG